MTLRNMSRNLTFSVAAEEISQDLSQMELMHCLQVTGSFERLKHDLSNLQDHVQYQGMTLTRGSITCSLSYIHSALKSATKISRPNEKVLNN